MELKCGGDLVQEGFFDYFCGMFARIVITFLLLCPAVVRGAVPGLDSLLNDLDYELSIAREVYVEPKEAQLEGLRSLLGRSSKATDRFSILKQLHGEYLYYQYDSAYHYARRMERLADSMNDSLRISQARLALLECFASAGLLHEARTMVEQVDFDILPVEERIEGYLDYAKLLQNMESYVAGSDDLVKTYVDRRRTCYDEVLRLADPSSYSYAIAEVEKLRIDNYDSPMAITRSKHIIDSHRTDAHQKAINYSTIGLSYLSLNNADSAAYYLALSAIYDIRSNTRETTAAKDLARLMLEL